MPPTLRILPKGTKISCPNCKKVIGISLVDIVSGDKLFAKNFEPVAPQEFIPHTPMRSVCCDKPFFKQKIHTVDGWV